MNRRQAVKCELAAEVLHEEGNLRLQVMGWSMLPTIWPGDTIVVDRSGPNSVVAGDIVVFRATGPLVAHRVLESHEGKFLTRGDSLKWPDAPVTKGEFLGRVSSILRHGKEIEPRRSLRAGERWAAAVFQYSRFTARVTSRLYRTLNGLNFEI